MKYGTFRYDTVEVENGLKPKTWWNEVKRISDHTTMCVNKDILSILALENNNVNDFSNDEIANHINDCFLDPQQSCAT